MDPGSSLIAKAAAIKMHLLYVNVIGFGVFDLKEELHYIVLMLRVHLIK